MATTTPATGFALGIAPEDKLSMPLDALIKTSKAENKAKAAANASSTGKKATAKKQKATSVTAASASTSASPALTKKQKQKQKKAAARQLLNVKKTVTVPVSKAARARATTKASSSKRQAEINKRRPGLVVPKAAQTMREVPVPVQVRRQQTSALRVARAASGPASAAGKRRQAQSAKTAPLDVSNIQRHFATHPAKFDLPKGTNLRITINLNKVKPVVGAKK